MNRVLKTHRNQAVQYSYLYLQSNKVLYAPIISLYASLPYSVKWLYTAKCAIGVPCMASAVSWLWIWYTIICQRIMTNPPTVVVVLYEMNVLLVCFICFCPTDEQMSAYDKGKPELVLWIISLCILLVVCLLCASLRLLHLRVTQSYTACMYYVFIFVHDI